MRIARTALAALLLSTVAAHAVTINSVAGEAYGVFAGSYSGVTIDGTENVEAGPYTLLVSGVLQGPIYCDDILNFVNFPTDYLVTTPLISSAILPEIASLLFYSAADAATQIAMWEIEFPSHTFTNMAPAVAAEVAADLALATIAPPAGEALGQYYAQNFQGLIFLDAAPTTTIVEPAMTLTFLVAAAGLVGVVRRKS